MAELKTNRPAYIEYVKPVKMRELAKKGFDMRQVEKLSKAMAAVMSKNMLKAKPDSKNHIDIALEDSRRQIDLMKIDIGIINSNIGALQQDVKASLGLLSEAIESIKKLGATFKEHANKIMASQQSSSSSMMDMLAGAGLAGGLKGLKSAGAVIKSGVSTAIKGVGSAIGSAGRFAKGLGAAGMAVSTYEALEMYRDQSDDLSERYGDDWKKQLGGAAQKSYRMVTDREASLEEINRLTPEEASSVLENGYPKDIERYGKERLETRAKGQTVSASPAKPEGGPEESKAVREKREELQKQERIDKSVGGVNTANTQSSPAASFQASMPSSGPDGVQVPGGIKPVAETGDATRAMQSFVADGWTKEQAAGIVGNLQAESGPNLKTDSVGDNGKAYGIAQWHPDRQAKFKEVYKKDIREAGFEEQLAFIKWELANSEARAGRLLRQAKTAAEAAQIMDRFYERSSGQHTAQRIANAENLSKNSPSTAPVPAIQAAIGDVVGPPPVASGDIAKSAADAPAAQAAAIQSPSASSVSDYSEGSSTKAGAQNTHKVVSENTQTVNTKNKEVITSPSQSIVPRSTFESAVEGSSTKAGAANLARFNATGRPDALNFKQDFAGSLGSFLTTAKQSGHDITIQSGFRSPELQSVLYKQAIQKYGNETEARKWVAPPGQSNHAKGIAADLGFSSPSAKSWAHSNAQKFGLNFRMAHEPWHIEPTGIGGSNVDYNPDGVQSASPGSSEGNGISASPVSAPTIAETQQKFSGLMTTLSALTSTSSAPIVRPSSPGSSLETVLQAPAQPSNAPIAGLVGAISNIGNMVGSMAGMLGALTTKPGYSDTPNPDLAYDENTRNDMPSAMPSNRMLAQLFDLNVGNRSKILGYAFE
jgi:LAS superfamily LD-carboxypeptidase LdcB